jgi:Cu+-exporting ATPase
MGHLVVIGAKTGEYVHAHPESGTAPDGKVLFAVHFKQPGLYKAWGQFQRQGRVFTVPVVLSVE